MNYSEFVDSLPDITRELTVEEKDSVRRLLNTTSVKTALALVMLERSKLAQTVLAMDLSDKTADQALAALARRQGEAIGIQKAIAFLFELVEEEEPNPAEDENHE